MDTNTLRILFLVVLAVCSACTTKSSSDSSTTRTRIPTGPSTPCTNCVAPTISGLVTLPEAIGVAGVTEYAFQVNVSNPSGAPVRILWDFADGASAEGATVRHIFANPGQYMVTARATNQYGSSNQATASVETKSLTAEWRGEYLGNVELVLYLIQDGRNLSGTAVEPYDRLNGVVRMGSLVTPSGVEIRLRMNSNAAGTIFRDYTLSGTWDSQIDRLSGSLVTGTQGFELYRQK